MSLKVLWTNSYHDLITLLHWLLANIATVCEQFLNGVPFVKLFSSRFNCLFILLRGTCNHSSLN